MKFIIYEGSDEILICSLKEEPRLIKEYFPNKEDRDIDNYERTVHKKSIVEITSRLHVRPDIIK